MYSQKKTVLRIQRKILYQLHWIVTIAGSWYKYRHALVNGVMLGSASGMTALRMRGILSRTFIPFKKWVLLDRHVINHQCKGQSHLTSFWWYVYADRRGEKSLKQSWPYRWADKKSKMVLCKRDYYVDRQVGILLSAPCIFKNLKKFEKKTWQMIWNVI